MATGAADAARARARQKRACALFALGPGEGGGPMSPPLGLVGEGAVVAWVASASSQAAMQDCVGWVGDKGGVNS